MFIPNPEKKEHMVDPNDKNVIIMYHEKYRSRWTTSDSGNNSGGGWTEKGLSMFNEYREHVKKHRAMAESLAFEREFLEYLQEKAGNDGQNGKGRGKKGKRKSAGGKNDGGPAQKKQAVVDTADDSFFDSIDDEACA